jgi:hypothetical protein
MNSLEILAALEKERELLEDFICLSEEQLLLLADEDLDTFDTLLTRRANLMVNLTDIEQTLAAWILQLQNDDTMPGSIMHEMRLVNDEIVRMANYIVQIDERAHLHLGAMQQRTSAELRSIERGRQALELYAATYATVRQDIELSE